MDGVDNGNKRASDESKRKVFVYNLSAHLHFLDSFHSRRYCYEIKNRTRFDGVSAVEKKSAENKF
jgi:hypothetical protein